MKAYLSLIILLLTFATQAQEIPFEKLDSLSTLISQLQKQTDGKACKGFNDDIYELSYPGENFKVWSHDRLATNAVYKKKNDKEILALTEDIDFSKTTGISVGDDYNGVVYIKVTFPAGHLKTQFIENGKVISTDNVNYLEFFCAYGSVDANRKFFFDKMFDYLYELSTLLKTEKKLMTKSDVKNELADWGKLNGKDFIAKYPKSILSEQAFKNKADYDKSMRNAQIWLDNFCKDYHFVPGASPDAVAASNKILAKAIRKGSEDYKEDGQMFQHYTNAVVRKQFYDAVFIKFTSHSELYSIMYQSFNSPNKAFYSQLVSFFKQKLPSELLMPDKYNPNFTVFSPDKKYKVTVFSDNHFTILFTMLPPR
jgi:hypothetical protein